MSNSKQSSMVPAHKQTDPDKKPGQIRNPVTLGDYIEQINNSMEIEETFRKDEEMDEMTEAALSRAGAQISFLQEENRLLRSELTRLRGADEDHGELRAEIRRLMVLARELVDTRNERDELDQTVRLLATAQTRLVSERDEAVFRRDETIAMCEQLRAERDAAALAEREACAQVCDAASNDPNEWAYERAMATRCAAAIRARGDKL